MKSTLSDSISFSVFCLPTSGLLLVVLVDDLDRHAADLAAEMVERELERVAHVVADDRGRAAEGRDKADLDGLLLRQGRRGPEQQERGRRE